MPFELVFLLLIVIALAHALSRGPRNRFGLGFAFQNHGEAKVLRALKGRFGPPDYHLLHHVTLRTSGGSTQIDHILVSRFGVFVIETKDLGGWIFGDASSASWTQVLFRAKFRFQNPIHQNYRHVCAVRDLLDFLPPSAIHSAVVFTGRATFKTPVPPGVFELDELIAYIASQTNAELTANRMQFCVGRLETARLAITKATDIEHVERLRRRYGSRD
jgi:hypothetical protein